MKKTVILQASSKSMGNTHHILEVLNEDNSFDIIDLSTKNIGHFDYDMKNAEDDFIPLMENLLSQYDSIVLATPIYWYTMSGILKVFMDRLSDLLHYRKDLGRQLRGKSLAVLSNSGDNDRRPGFTMPFEASAAYLGMHYLGDVHVWFDQDGQTIATAANEQLQTFKQSL
ncbi:FMN reductase [Tenacibaculum litopenaei]|uniref:flavodoxin family protein n=1 Tax=Tenacibaculum litopenaei TaxID=396016 RepID=UPI0038960F44